MQTGVSESQWREDPSSMGETQAFPAWRAELLASTTSLLRTPVDSLG